MVKKKEERKKRHRAGITNLVLCVDFCWMKILGALFLSYLDNTRLGKANTGILES